MYRRRYESRRSLKTKLHKKTKKYGAKRFSIWRMEFFHSATWDVALGWHAIGFAKTSAILEFCFWFRFRPYHRSWHVILHQSAKFYPNLQHKQELTYRKQIARQLRTQMWQYVEGIHRPNYYTVTLKSRLRVTQGHCKRNHWTDHTRLSSSRVIWRSILLWPWNVG